jgi:flagellar biosynthesis GTPase FlhF
MADKYKSACEMAAGFSLSFKALEVLESNPLLKSIVSGDSQEESKRIFCDNENKCTERQMDQIRKTVEVLGKFDGKEDCLGCIEMALEIRNTVLKERKEEEEKQRAEGNRIEKERIEAEQMAERERTMAERERTTAERKARQEKINEQARQDAERAQKKLMEEERKAKQKRNKNIVSICVFIVLALILGVVLLNGVISGDDADAPKSIDVKVADKYNHYISSGDYKSTIVICVTNTGKSKVTHIRGEMGFYNGEELIGFADVELMGDFNSKTNVFVDLEYLNEELYNTAYSDLNVTFKITGMKFKGTDKLYEYDNEEAVLLNKE